MRSDHIAAVSGMCGWLAYSPPKEVGRGQEIAVYSSGGFSIWTSSGPSGNSAPRQRRFPARPVSFTEARAIALDVDRYLAFEVRPGQPHTCLKWVEAIIADLPVVLQEAIETAEKRTNELRVLKAATTGDVT